MVERVSSRRKDGEDDDAAARPGADSRRGQTPKFDKKTIALVYDFDGTLSPKPMQEYAFLPKINTDPEAFWAESNRLAREHAHAHRVRLARDHRPIPYGLIANASKNHTNRVWDRRGK